VSCYDQSHWVTESAWLLTVRRRQIKTYIEHICGRWYHQGTCNRQVLDCSSCVHWSHRISHRALRSAPLRWHTASNNQIIRFINVVDTRAVTPYPVLLMSFGHAIPTIEKVCIYSKWRTWPDVDGPTKFNGVNNAGSDNGGPNNGIITDNQRPPPCSLFHTPLPLIKWIKFLLTSNLFNSATQTL